MKDAIAKYMLTIYKRGNIIPIPNVQHNSTPCVVAAVRSHLCRYLAYLRTESINVM